MTRLRISVANVLETLFVREASTRPVALMRIGLIVLAWARWSNDLVLFRRLQDGLWPLSVVFFIVTPLALLGCWTRLSMALSAACLLALVYYAGHGHGIEEYTHHHTTLLAWSCVWLAFTPCGRSYSLDRWCGVRNAERRGEAPPAERANLWAMRLLSLQASAVYFWGAVDKCNAGFLSGERMAHYVMYYYTGSSSLEEVPGVGTGLMVIAVTTVALEFALSAGMFFPRTRRLLVIPGMLLHGAIYMFLSVFTFSATMWVLYLAYCDADEVHAVLDRLQGARSQARSAPEPHWPNGPPSLP